MHVFGDFETRSKYLDVTKCGASKYSLAPETEALMFAYKLPSGERKVWALDQVTGRDPGIPDDLRKLIEDPNVIFHAHNAAFEMAIWGNIMVARLGWPNIPHTRWRCTAAKARYANQPGSLDNLCKRLRIDEGKDKRGKELIRLLSSPMRLTQKELKANPEKYIDVRVFPLPDKKWDFIWNNDPELHEEFREYCKQDIVAEENVDRRLPKWPDSEQGVYLFDQEINNRGIPLDREFCEGAVKIKAAILEVSNRKIHELTNGEVPKVTMDARLKTWVNKRINFGNSLAAEIVQEWVDHHDKILRAGKSLPPKIDEVYHALKLRTIARSNAISKYEKALSYVDSDNRLRGQLLYYGTATGRWAGRGVQVLNYPRLKIPSQIFFDAIASGDYERVDSIYDWCGTDGVVGLLKQCIRGMFKAGDGKTFVISDYAGIEPRVLSWLADDVSTLEMFRNNQDLYIATAAETFEVAIEDIANWCDEEGKWKIKKDHYVDGRLCDNLRQVGKQQTLGLGYGMGAEKFQATLWDKEQLDLPLDFCEVAVKKWRMANPEITKLWNRLERACIRTIKTKKAYRVGKLVTHWHPYHYLCIRLPSGRDLFYYNARPTTNKWGGDSIVYQDGGKGGGLGWTDTYGGKLVENVTQAVARDLLVHSMKLIDSQGLEIVLHVYDEVVAEVSENDVDKSYEVVHTAMQMKPEWADGIPLAAETQISKRYTK